MTVLAVAGAGEWKMWFVRRFFEEEGVWSPVEVLSRVADLEFEFCCYWRMYLKLELMVLLLAKQTVVGGGVGASDRIVHRKRDLVTAEGEL